MSGKRYTEEFKIAAVKQVAQRGAKQLIGDEERPVGSTCVLGTTTGKSRQS